jgi:hypothetical protein
MTLGGLRSFLKPVIDGLGYKYWADGFSVNNIPAQIVNKSYHLDIGRMQITNPLGAANGALYEFDHQVTLKVLRNGFRNPSDAIDKSLDEAQAIIQALITAGRTQAQNGFKRLQPVTIDTVAASPNNETQVITVMVFKVVLMFGF